MPARRTTQNKEQDVEVLALQAKLKREQACSAEINALLKKHRCQYLLITQFEEGKGRRLDAILNLPVIIQVVST